MMVVTLWSIRYVDAAQLAAVGILYKAHGNNGAKQTTQSNSQKDKQTEKLAL